MKREQNLNFLGTKIRDRDSDIRDFIKKVDAGEIEGLDRYDRSDITRACLRMAKDHQELLLKYLHTNPQSPQITLDEQLANTGS